MSVGHVFIRRRERGEGEGGGPARQVYGGRGPHDGSKPRFQRPPERAGASKALLLVWPLCCMGPNVSCCECFMGPLVRSQILCTSEFFLCVSLGLRGICQQVQEVNRTWRCQVEAGTPTDMWSREQGRRWRGGGIAVRRLRRGGKARAIVFVSTLSHLLKKKLRVFCRYDLVNVTGDFIFSGRLRTYVSHLQQDVCPKVRNESSSSGP